MQFVTFVVQHNNEVALVWKDQASATSKYFTKQIPGRN
jgi:hypothetical protein